MKTQFEPAAGGFFLEIRISNIGFMNENGNLKRKCCASESQFSFISPIFDILVSKKNQPAAG